MRIYRRTRYAGHGEVPSIESVTLPAIYTKYLETVTHSFLSTLHCTGARPDAALVCNTVNAVLLPLLAAAGIPTVLNVDGIEWQRRKWNAVGRGIHWLSEHLAVRLADIIVADGQTIQAYYWNRHRVETAFIAYGGELPPPRSTQLLDDLRLRPGGYDLCVCRFEPENNPLAVVRAHARLATRTPLIMVGGAPYARRYEQAVRRAAGAGTRFLGPRFAEEYRQLLFHARAVIYAGEVGGTHPVLLEAMGAGRLVVYNDTPENRETVGPAGLPYGPGGEEALLEVWRRLDREPELRDRLGRLASERVHERYRWEAVTGAYEELFLRLAGR